METTFVADAVASLEKANADLEPELLSVQNTRDQLASYARAKKLAAFGEAMLAHRLDDAQAVARVTGTSVGKAKNVVETGKALGSADEVDCGSRYRCERDHLEPHVAKGPSSLVNIWCPPCHEVKTIEDLRAGKFTGGDAGRSPPR